jgi:hypothetical protein
MFVNVFRCLLATAPICAISIHRSLEKTQFGPDCVGFLGHTTLAASISLQLNVWSRPYLGIMNGTLADCLLFQTVRYATNRMCTLQKTSLKYLSAISMYVNGAIVSVYIRLQHLGMFHKFDAKIIQIATFIFVDIFRNDLLLRKCLKIIKKMPSAYAKIMRACAQRNVR